MEIFSLGDSALLVRVTPPFQADPVATLRAVDAVMRKLGRANLPEILECAPAYDSVALYLNLARLLSRNDSLVEALAHLQKQLADLLDDSSDDQEAPSAEIEIPVCYDAAFALDLDEVARHTGLTSAEVVQLHRAGNYLVHCVGFMPGFPYLGGLPEELATPRRATPRKEVPAGSVAIGGAQTGIYPRASPGGWNIIGRTPLRLFDPSHEPAALLRSGMRVRFRAITRAQFDTFAK